MLRMGKLMDIKNVKRLMKSIMGETNTADQIIKLYDKLFQYKLMRLLLVLIVLTYFQGCFWFLMSKSHVPDVEGQLTWYETFGLNEIERISDQLIISLYFALTMLSTVGYGDTYPVTAIGQTIAAIIAILGIGMFALPAGILGAGFVDALESRRKEENGHTCPHCGEALDEY